MEYLDVYDENQKFIGKHERSYVHENALWHKTVHCWIYDKEGNIYFQKRKDRETFYTTASGHVLALESVEEAFVREIKEEIGLDLDVKKAKLIDIVIFKCDMIKNGKPFKDRVFANVFVYDITKEKLKFKFDENEVTALLKVNAKETLKLFEENKGNIDGVIITDNGLKQKKVKINILEFLVNKNETLFEKYGFILKSVIDLTSE